MKSKEIMKIINETLEQLEKNTTKCLENNDGEHAKLYMNYATGVRMILDNIELSQ